MVRDGDCLNRAQAPIKVGIKKEKVKTEFSTELATGMSLIGPESLNQAMYYPSKIAMFTGENVYECPPTDVILPNPINCIFTDINFVTRKDMYETNTKITFYNCGTGFTPQYRIPQLKVMSDGFITILPKYSALLNTNQSFTITLFIEIVNDSSYYSGDTTLLTIPMITANSTPMYYQIFTRSGLFDLYYRYVYNNSVVEEGFFGFPEPLTTIKLMSISILGLSDLGLNFVELGDAIYIRTDSGIDSRFPFKSTYKSGLDMTIPISIGSFIRTLRDASGCIVKRVSILSTNSMRTLTEYQDSLFYSYYNSSL